MPTKKHTNPYVSTTQLIKTPYAEEMVVTHSVVDNVSYPLLDSFKITESNKTLLFIFKTEPADLPLIKFSTVFNIENPFEGENTEGINTFDLFITLSNFQNDKVNSYNFFFNYNDNGTPSHFVLVYPDGTIDSRRLINISQIGWVFNDQTTVNIADLIFNKN